MIPESEILFIRSLGVKGDIGVITLNRPRVLNVLNESMCIALHNILNEWQA